MARRTTQIGRTPAQQDFEDKGYDWSTGPTLNPTDNIKLCISHLSSPSHPKTKMAPIGTLYTTPTQAKGKIIRAAAALGGAELTLAPFEMRVTNKSPEYLAKFPLGKVPAFEGPDGFKLFEGDAIGRYVANLVPNANLLGATPQDAALINQWIHAAETEVDTYDTWVRYLCMGMIPYNKAAETAFYERLERGLDSLESHISTRTFFVTERITLADLSIAAFLQKVVSSTVDAKRRIKYPNLLRHLETIVNQPTLKEIYGEVQYTEKQLAFVPPAKEKKAPAPAPPKAEKKPKKEEVEEEEPDVPPEPKAKNPLDDLPKSSLNLEDWKRAYSNKDTRGPGGAIEWFYQNYDPAGFSVWRVDFKYNEELTLTFMSSNQITGFFNRLEASRKYLFASVGVLGENNNSVIAGTLIARGTEIEPVVNVAPDWESYNYKKLDLSNEADKAFFEAALAWDLEIDGKKWADGKNFLLAVLLAWAFREYRGWSLQKSSAAKDDSRLVRRSGESEEVSGDSTEGDGERESEEMAVEGNELKGGVTRLTRREGESQGEKTQIPDEQELSKVAVPSPLVEEVQAAETEDSDKVVDNIPSAPRDDAAPAAEARPGSSSFPASASGPSPVQEELDDSNTPTITPSERSQVLGQQAMTVSGGFFNNSHDLVFNNSVMYSIQKTTEHGYTLPGAEFDSSLRDPPPRCHPGTRIDIRQMIVQWIDDPQRTHRFLWLRGTAGVGKSAIVQTLTEELWSASKLGAAFFFSRPNKLRNPIFVFPTLAYQIAVRLPAYRAYLEEKMAEDPKILEKGIERQFHILFVSPFSVISEAQVGRLAVFLDGLDECDGPRAQTLIVKLIASFTLHHPASPLVWVIASRPEVHLNTVFETVEVSRAVWAHDVPSNGDKASLDVEKYLRENFRQIQSKHHALIHEHASWPVEQDITQICSASSGNYALASTIIRVIDDPEVNDPISQLQVVLSITTSPHSDPLLTLYALYTKVFDAVPKVLLPSLKLVLTYHLLASKHLPYDFGSSLVLVATLFGLERDIVYDGLRKLQSVMEYPLYEKAGSENIRFRHASLSDYLQDASLSGGYTIFTEALDFRSEVWQCCLHFIKRYSHHATPWSNLEFAWKTNLSRTDAVKHVFWMNVLRTILNFILESPSLKAGEDTSDIRTLSSPADICATFEALDFTQLTFERSSLLRDLCRLTRQLFDKPSRVLAESDLVEKVELRDLDLARILDKKLAFRAEVTFILKFDNYNQNPDTWGPLPGTEKDPLATYFVRGKVQTPTIYTAWWSRHATTFSNSPDESLMISAFTRVGLIVISAFSLVLSCALSWSAFTIPIPTCMSSLSGGALPGVVH
ncbi:hypothetical protein D9756_009939 [Leucocoprinus leucothites]|uniref:Elongation factor 1-gamma n=1 Tax=Leucocoprinus leucothites TaxID=201217 RepID=A0A8H5CV78_9AGAR|nr:hypothetical protein D9756_009939 [Leucoagaricus leucothites]